jgi:hypothetical protein
MVNNDKKNNLLAIVIFTFIALSIVAYIRYDANKVKKHIQECVEICKPDEVIDTLSFEHCVCKKVLKIEDTI